MSAEIMRCEETGQWSDLCYLHHSFRCLRCLKIHVLFAKRRIMYRLKILFSWTNSFYVHYCLNWSLDGLLLIHDGGIVVLNRICAPILSTITPPPLFTTTLQPFHCPQGGCLVFSNSIYPARVKISISNSPISATESQPGNYGCSMGENIAVFR